jgi:hypothetical protein
MGVTGLEPVTPSLSSRRAGAESYGTLTAETRNGRVSPLSLAPDFVY